MAQVRVSMSLPGKLFAAAAHPVYLLDAERRIVFVNSACAHWTGVPEEELLGQQCQYAMPSEGSPAVVAAALLCPPPDVFAQWQSQRGVVAARLSSGDLVRRTAEFNVLTGAGDDLPVVLAIVGASVVEDEVAAKHPLPPADVLHRQLQTQWEARHRLGNLVGESLALRRARKQIELAIAARSGALMVGPRGSGREYTARIIHYGEQALAGSGAMLPLECSLLEAEVLQNTVVSFLRRRREYPASAAVAIALLEVDRLPPDGQLELEGLLKLPGIDVQIFATSERSLIALAEAGKFRGELATRLSTLEIELPSLTERLADLPLLAQHFLERHNATGGRQLAGFTPEALERLVAYSWPGQVEELADVVRATCAKCEGTLVSPADLPRRLELAASAARYPSAPEENIELDTFLAEVERELIQRALGQAKGNKTKAAELLGLNRARLLRRMTQLGLAAPEPPASDDETPIFEQI